MKQSEANVPSKDKVLVDIVKECISKTVETFLSNPFLFYIESDLHCFLYNQLYGKLVQSGLDGIFETCDQKKSILLHKEYPTKERYSRKHLKIEPEGSRGHFDLCIWNPTLVNERLFRASKTEDIKKEQQTFIAIEFNLVEHNSNLGDAIHHMKWDRLKLSDYAALEQTKDPKKKVSNEVKYGYLLFFVRDWIHSDEFLRRIREEIPKEPEVIMLYIESSGSRRIVKTLSQSQLSYNQVLNVEAPLKEHQDFRARLSLFFPVRFMPFFSFPFLSHPVKMLSSDLLSAVLKNLFSA